MTETQIPSKAQILEWVSDNPDANSKRDIAKAFGIKGADRIELKRLLKELEAEGQLEASPPPYLDAAALPPVTVLEMVAPDGTATCSRGRWNGRTAADAAHPEGAAQAIRHSGPATGSWGA